MKKNNSNMSDDKHKHTSIGGQAVLEGVMMRGKEHWAIAVRKPDNEMAIESFAINSPSERYPILKKPIIRGMIAMADAMILGVKAISFSAQYATEEEEEQISGKEMAGAMVVAIILTIGLFFVLPAFLTSLMDKYIANTVAYNVLEGLIRIGIFVCYILVISMIKDISRVFEYHGAEHKTIHAYEAGIELTPDSVEAYSTKHMRCGTAFLLIVMVVLILVFAFLGRPGFWMRVVSRLIVIPIVAGLSYEAIKYAARHEDSKIIQAIMWPGLLLQRLTTREPDKDQLEVAIAALKEILRIEHDDEKALEA